MFGIIAVVCFALALILHLIGGHADLVTDFALGGLLALSVHLLYDWRPWGRPPA